MTITSLQPPQFANSPPKDNQTNGIYNYQTIKRANGVTTNASLNAASTKAPKPPSSPIPDYDNRQQQRQHPQPKVDKLQQQQLQINSLTKQVPKQQQQQQHGTKVHSSNSSAQVPPSPTRRTIRLGAVTIGEYEQQRKEPNKFEFIAAQNGHNAQNGAVNGGHSFQSELQNTLSRSKLKHVGGSVSNGNNHQHHLEHKRDCPLRNGYGAENSSRNQNQKQLLVNCEGTATVKRNVNGNIYSTPPGQNGILKNGNSRSSAIGGLNGLNGHSSKITEKTITFGN